MPRQNHKVPLERVNDYCWRIPKSYNPAMRVDGLIYASRQLIDFVRRDPAPEQVANVATLDRKSVV
jgi:tRNA-splicing ligase RtcB